MRRGGSVHTYSIIAVDTKSGLMGGAVQSHYFSVGGTVIRAEAGSGVIATQAMVNMDYGPAGLKLLREGMSAAEVIKQLTADDQAADIRQAAAVDCSGNAFAHTGGSTIRYAGHLCRRGVSVQANMMLNDSVPQAMYDAFAGSEGSLQHRLLQSLMAAERAGGDIRGMQSAAILIVPILDKGTVRDNIVMDLRVEDHPEPLAELQRLLNIQAAYYHADQGDLAVENSDMKKAMTEYRLAEELQPGNPELMFWKAVSLLNADETGEAELILNGLSADGGNWIELLKRLPAAGILNLNRRIAECIERVEKNCLPD